MQREDGTRPPTLTVPCRERVEQRLGVLPAADADRERRAELQGGFDLRGYREGAHGDAGG